MRRALAEAAAGYTAWAPSRSRSIRVGGTQWAMLSIVLGIALLTHVALPDHVSAAILNPMGASIGIAAVAGLRRSSCRSAWNFLAAGVTAYAAADTVGLMSAEAAVEHATLFLYVAAYAAFAAGFALFVAQRR